MNHDVSAVFHDIVSSCESSKVVSSLSASLFVSQCVIDAVTMPSGHANDKQPFKPTYLLLVCQISVR